MTEAADARKRLHDMRNALAPALMLAERLEAHSDPKVADLATRIAAMIEAAVRIGTGREDKA